MMADVVSGAIPRPIELGQNGPITKKWTAACPAWHKLQLPDLSSVGIVANNEGVINPVFGYTVFRCVGDLREFLGERGPAVLYNGVVIVFNIDGTRAAVEQLPVPICARPVPMTNELITITAAAKLLGVSTQAISMRIRTGTLTSYTDPDEPNPQRATRVLRAEVEKLLI